MFFCPCQLTVLVVQPSVFPLVLFLCKFLNWWSLFLRDSCHGSLRPNNRDSVSEGPCEVSHLEFHSQNIFLLSCNTCVSVAIFMQNVQEWFMGSRLDLGFVLYCWMIFFGSLINHVLYRVRCIVKYCDRNISKLFRNSPAIDACMKFLTSRLS